VNDVFNRLKYMPTILRTLCMASLGLGVIMPVLACFPSSHVQIFDDDLTVRELWAQGYGPFFVISGGELLLQGIGLYRGISWSRWLVVFQYLFIVPLVAIYLFHHDSDQRLLVLQTLVAGVLWAALAYWYLFHKQKDQFIDETA
jgi:hypothetical protein